MSSRRIAERAYGPRTTSRARPHFWGWWESAALATVRRTSSGVDPTIRVFLCDDVPAFRMLLRYTLEEDPEFEVVGEAADGATGVEGVRRTQPDVVLLDLAMPGADGLQALPGMRAAAPGAQIIGLSGYAAERVASDMLAAGAAAYLEKGADPQVIQQTVRDLAHRAA